LFDNVINVCIYVQRYKKTFEEKVIDYFFDGKKKLETIFTDYLQQHEKKFQILDLD